MEWLQAPYLQVAFGVRADVERRAGGNPSTNVGVDYATLLNQSGQRADVEPMYARPESSLTDDLATLAVRRGSPRTTRRAHYLANNASFTGRLGRPVLTLHNVADGALPTLPGAGSAGRGARVGPGRVPAPALRRTGRPRHLHPGGDDRCVRRAHGAGEDRPLAVPDAGGHQRARQEAGSGAQHRWRQPRWHRRTPRTSRCRSRGRSSCADAGTRHRGARPGRGAERSALLCRHGGASRPRRRPPDHPRGPAVAPRAAAEIDLSRPAPPTTSCMAAVDAHVPDVVLTDIRMPPGLSDEGIRAAAELREPPSPTWAWSCSASTTTRSS